VRLAVIGRAIKGFENPGGGALGSGQRVFTVGGITVRKKKRGARA